MRYEIHFKLHYVSNEAHGLDKCSYPQNTPVFFNKLQENPGGQSIDVTTSHNSIVLLPALPW